MFDTNSFKSVIKNYFPKYNKILKERDQLRRDIDKLNQFVSPGHFYSPIPSLDEIKKDELKIFDFFTKIIPGVELNESSQLSLLEELATFYKEIPFNSKKTEGLRYYFENPAYSYSDGIFLYSMIRFLKPKRILEVGSGYSSCVTLDTNEKFFNNSIHTTFVEPYPDLLLNLITPEDKKRINLIPKRLQEIDLGHFEVLEKNDILFIDSTHVSKINSDVNRIFFEILPRLASGVYVHFHDIFFPFEYPKEWVFEGRFWNEQYILHAFLQYNNTFQIVLMNTFLENFQETFFREKMPLCLKNKGGSIWIRKE